MEIKEFLEQNVGKWFSQRTLYHLAHQKAENNKSEITIEGLSPEHPEVVKLCQQGKINPSSTLGGTKSSWDNSGDWGQTKQVGFATIVWIPSPENPQMGQILRLLGNPPQTLVVGSYTLGDDRSLTLIIEDDLGYSEERIWFASPNLRLRTSLIKNQNSFTQTAFYSEIRKLTT